MSTGVKTVWYKSTESMGVKSIWYKSTESTGVKSIWYKYKRKSKLVNSIYTFIQFLFCTYELKLVFVSFLFKISFHRKTAV